VGASYSGLYEEGEVEYINEFSLDEIITVLPVHATDMTS
jgi:hypothetical protein